MTKALHSEITLTSSITPANEAADYMRLAVVWESAVRHICEKMCTFAANINKLCVASLGVSSGKMIGA